MIHARSSNIIQFDPGLNTAPNHFNCDLETYGQYNKRFTPWKYCPLQVFEKKPSPKHLSTLINQEDGSLVYGKLNYLGVPLNAIVYCSYFMKGKTKQHGFCYDVFEPNSRLYVRIYNRLELVCKKLRPHEVPDFDKTLTEQDILELGIPDKIDRITDNYDRFKK